jgi:KUP system potassium uptake protein
MNVQPADNTLQGHIWKSILLGFQTLGSMYGIFIHRKAHLGDIATSPLYVFAAYTPLIIRVSSKRTFPKDAPSEEDVLGATSCIVWCLTLIPLIKYSWIVLRASSEDGEGNHTYSRLMGEEELLFFINS